MPPVAPPARRRLVADPASWARSLPRTPGRTYHTFRRSDPLPGEIWFTPLSRYARGPSRRVAVEHQIDIAQDLPFQPLDRIASQALIARTFLIAPGSPASPHVPGASPTHTSPPRVSPRARSWLSGSAATPPARRSYPLAASAPSPCPDRRTAAAGSEHPSSQPALHIDRRHLRVRRGNSKIARQRKIEAGTNRMYPRNIATTGLRNCRYVVDQSRSAPSSTAYADREVRICGTDPPGSDRPPAQKLLPAPLITTARTLRIPARALDQVRRNSRSYPATVR